MLMIKGISFINQNLALIGLQENEYEKGRKDVNGKPFSSAFEANKELTRLKENIIKLIVTLTIK